MALPPRAAGPCAGLAEVAAGIAVGIAVRVVWSSAEALPGRVRESLGTTVFPECSQPLIPGRGVLDSVPVFTPSFVSLYRRKDRFTGHREPHLVNGEPAACPVLVLQLPSGKPGPQPRGPGDRHPRRPRVRHVLGNALSPSVARASLNRLLGGTAPAGLAVCPRLCHLSGERAAPEAVCVPSSEAGSGRPPRTGPAAAQASSDSAAVRAARQARWAGWAGSPVRGVSEPNC